MAIHVPSQVPSGVTQEGDGIVVGSGAVPVDAYIDFLCPSAGSSRRATAPR